jgi:hypothetical protein
MPVLRSEHFDNHGIYFVPACQVEIWRYLRVCAESLHDEMRFMRVLNFDELVRDQKTLFSVIPADPPEADKSRNPVLVKA